MSEAKPIFTGSLVRRPLLAAALAASAVAPVPAMAAYDIFLKLDNLVGESTVKGYEKWVQLFSFSSGFQVATAFGIPGVGVGRATCAPIGVTKSVDRASPPLLTAVMTGQRYIKGEIDFVRVSENGGVFFKYDLENVLVSSLQETGSTGGDNTPDESLSLNFTKLTVSYYPQDPTGKLGNPVVSSINCSQSRGQ